MAHTYAITGGATGIGAAVKQKLRERGDKVLVIDIKDADIIADLSTQEGRGHAIKQLFSCAPEGLDGFIPCAGLGPNVSPCSTITRVNYFAVTALTSAVLPLLEKLKGSIVIISSNSAPLPGLNKDYVKLLADNDEAGACKLIDTLDGHTAYAGSKYAIATWMRKNSAEYMRKGVRMNAVAPGVTQTPMTDKVFTDEQFGEAIRQFNEMTPYGEMATPDMIADVIVFLLDPISSFVCGSVLFVDGGTDAMLRPENF